MLLIKGVIAPALGALLLWITTRISTWIKDKVKNDKVAAILERLDQLAFKVVQEVQQTVVDGLGDKANAEALRAARDRAIATLKSHLGKDGLRELETAFGLENESAAIDMLITIIESAVHTLRRESAQSFTTATLQTTSSEGSPVFVEKTLTTVSGSPQ
jgi:hypothetical protein